MKTSLLGIAIAVSLLAHLVTAFTLWPLPYALTTGNSVVSLSATQFKIVTSSQSSVLQAAIQRYQTKILFPFTSSGTRSGAPVLATLNVTVSSDSQNLQLGVDESYSLSVTSGSSTRASLTAATIFGAMRGLESFSQFVDYDASSMTYAITQTPLTVTDQPRFAWRGLLIDSARHYLPIDTIYRTLDAMSYSKFNTLHWHAVDAESFPVEIDAYPQLANKGAWAPTATYDSTDIANVVQYALERGIRVVMEFDMPGHAFSWGKGYSNLTAVCPSYASNINNIPLDPTQTFTYSVIQAIISQMASVTPDYCMHIGGDEVITGCWMQDSSITSWMKSHGIANAQQLLQYFENQVAPIMTANNRTTVVWEDLFDSGITMNKNSIIEVWDNAASLNSIIKAGYRAITAYGNYLNNQVPIPGQEVSQWVDTWKTFYGNDPYNGLTATPQQLALVLGGEAAMWGEQVNGVNYDSRVWPRACAVGERLWSPQAVTSVTAAQTRLIEHACRLEQRGVRSGPIQPDYCVLPSDVTAYLKRLERREARRQKQQQQQQ